MVVVHTIIYLPVMFKHLGATVDSAHVKQLGFPFQRRIVVPGQRLVYLFETPVPLRDVVKRFPWHYNTLGVFKGYNAKIALDFKKEALNGNKYVRLHQEPTDPVFFTIVELDHYKPFCDKVHIPANFIVGKNNMIFREGFEICGCGDLILHLLWQGMP